MNRRHFLSWLGIAAAALAIDPERLLWTPGATTHILPPPQGWDLSGYHPLPVAMPPSLALNLVTPELYPMINFQPVIPEETIRAAVKALADEIDRRCLVAYSDRQDLAFLAGDQWPPEVVSIRKAEKYRVLTAGSW